MLTAADHIKNIEILVRLKKCDYIDAALLYCERNNFELEFIAEIIKKDNTVLTKFEDNAKDLNFLKKHNVST